MYTEVFIKDFSELGRVLDSYLNDRKQISCIEEALKHSFESNPFFTRSMQISALKAISTSFLEDRALRGWIDRYRVEISEQDIEILIVMAGNIPLVGFHDLLTVLASGRIAVVKLSSKDNFLIPALCEILYNINSYWKNRIRFRKDADNTPKLVIATGSDETAEFFKARYPGIPSVIRGAKSSVAVLKGDEDGILLDKLANDIFLYFGLGCRSVSTILTPESYDLKKLAGYLSRFYTLTQCEIYRDAYRYQKAISLVSGEWFLDGGFFIFKKNCTLPPPPGVVGIVEYNDENEVGNFIATNIKSLQCIVNFNYQNRFQPIGTTQLPALSDYADGVNTLEFILKNS